MPVRFAPVVLVLSVALAACASSGSGNPSGSGQKLKSTSHKPARVDTFQDQNAANLALRSGRDDAVAADSPVLAYAAKQSHGSFKTVGAVIESAPYGIAVPKKSAKLRDAIAAALVTVLHNGNYASILAKWGVSDGALHTVGINGATGSPTAAPTGNPRNLLPATIKSKGVVTVASDAAYAPIESFAADNKTIVGVDPDIGAAIGQVLGVRFKFVNVTFNGIIPALESGRYDIAMSAMTDNATREKQLDFVDYFTAGSAIMVRTSDPMGITGYNKTLCGHSVAVETGTVEVDQVNAVSKTC